MEYLNAADVLPKEKQRRSAILFSLTMSYPDIEDQSVRQKMDKASMLITSNTVADEESEYSSCMNYLSESSRDYTLAKDVRIFEMHDWLWRYPRSGLHFLFGWLADRFLH